ncbi:MAG TPA: hypothetical protein PLI04_06055 [Verrucomicrobiota bacterium]|nr:hypothetical protein [Verrucomicrobiota bacterium]
MSPRVFCKTRPGASGRRAFHPLAETSAPRRKIVWRGLAFLLAALTPAVGAAPVMRTMKTASAGVPLLANGGFEKTHAGRPVSWTAWRQGGRLAPGEGRQGTHGVMCERRDGGGEYGFSQTLTLNRTNVAPFIIRGWSKAEQVSGSPDGGYALYVDILYTDGTPLWGQTASFNCGTHDWEQRQFILLPDKPVRSLTLHCLFRGHTGKVWFDDAAVEEVAAPAGAFLFQGVPLQPSPREEPPRRAATTRLATRDGLKLILRGGASASLRVGRTELGSHAPAGFLARDFAAGSDFYGFAAEGSCAELGLRLAADFHAGADHIAVSGRLTDTTGRDRAVTLLFALPLDATGWHWGDDARQSRRIEGGGEFANTVNLRSGANGKMSLYPLAAVWNERAGLALGLDMDHPAQYRLVYHAGTRQFFIAYDFGLVPETARFPGGADFRFVIYRFDPRWGFRAALQKYYDLFPRHFVRRVQREGLWMPFTDIARVPNPADFGFAFQEGAPNVAFDDRHGIASFVYVEPMSYWLALPADAPRTYASALSVLTNDLRGARGAEKAEMAAATLTSGIRDAADQFALYLVKAPWCDGGVFTLNPDPAIPASPEYPFTKAGVMHRQIEAAFRRHQPAATNTTPGAGLDGVYLDSLEMSSAELNYRREHFRTAQAPLVFDREGRPCQLMIFNTWTFARELARQMHDRGKLVFANSVLWRFAFPAPLLDVLGTEVNWLSQGEYHPDTDAVMNFRRALCRQKPYCLLLNTDYAKFTPDRVERFFQRCLFYGVWPGFFDPEAASKDPYWASGNKWYERDRPLFKKYIPWFRQLTAAGWQAIPHATCDNPRIQIERFGPDPGGAVWLTLFNDTPHPQTGVITADLKALGLKRHPRARMLLSGTPAKPQPGGWQVSLSSQQAEILCLASESRHFQGQTD